MRKAFNVQLIFLIKTFIFSILFLMSLGVRAQEEKINLEKRKIDLTHRKEIITQPIKQSLYDSSKVGDTIRLKNNIVSWRYSKCALEIQHWKNRDINIYLRYGVTSDNKCFISYTLNDTRWDSAPVYVISYDSAYESTSQFLVNLPNIIIDSIRLYTIAGKPIFKKISFRAFIKDSRPESSIPLNRNDISNIRQPSLAIHSDYFFGGDFIYKNDIYELVVLPRPYLYDIFRDSTVMINRACPVLLYKRTHGMDSLFRKALSTSTINTKAKVADLKREFVINDHRIIINSIDSLSRQARMTVAKVVKYGDDSGIGEATVFDIKTKKKIPLHSLVKRTSVIMFSGSWCAPCKQILPTVKLFADSLKDKVDFFISLSEYTINEAIRYIHEQKIIWPSFYYNLSDLSNQRDLVSFMKVVSYPTFLLIDSKGNILSMGSSYSGLDSTRMKLASILD